jgi:hypothetical protein
MSASDEQPPSMHEPASTDEPASRHELASTHEPASTTEPASTPEPAAAHEPRSDQQPAPPPHRIRSGEVLSALSALLLLPIMFLLEWYGTVGLPRSRRSGIETAVNAWKELSIARWLLLLAIIVALGSVILHATQRSHGTKTDTSVLVAVTGTVAAVVLGYRVLIDLPHPSSVVDIKIGAYLGLLAILGIALGGYDSILEERARRGKYVRRRSGQRPLASGPTAR